MRCAKYKMKRTELADDNDNHNTLDRTTCTNPEWPPNFISRRFENSRKYSLSPPLKHERNVHNDSPPARAFFLIFLIALCVKRYPLAGLNFKASSISLYVCSLYSPRPNRIWRATRSLESRTSMCAWSFSAEIFSSRASQGSKTRVQSLTVCRSDHRSMS